MIDRIATAVVVVADQDTMLAFFTGPLGFTLTTDAEMWPGARWVEVAPPGGGTSLVLSAAKDFDREPDQVYPMTFTSSDLAATAARLTADGVEVTDRITEPWGTYIRVTDPEGRQLVVVDRVSNRA
ncbi:VOC family protein [Pseudonocardia sp. TRM90224]|uniref:VOC family protein n=1 Tax=Pseudonocardia sp. TRM90224 TaxID=2812678 RepID=UPI001E2F8409|nr:VOC family protein [Pseudonocardia sp. TRM90224]